MQDHIAAGPENLTALGPRSEAVKSLADQIREKKQQGQIFILRYTTEEPFPVRVKSPDAAYMMAYGGLPTHAQQLVDKLLKDPEMIDRGAAELLKTEGLDFVNAFMDLVNATCVAGFISPKLCFEQKADYRENEMWVEDIDPQDRQDFFAWCNGTAEATADAVKSDAGQESETDAPDPGSTRPAVFSDAYGGVPGVIPVVKSGATPGY